jgi:pilus assembly protein Flp/PilA
LVSPADGAERETKRPGVGRPQQVPGSFYQPEKVMSLVKSAVEFLKREDGPTAVEYAVMLALIIVVCIAAVTTLGQNANTQFSSVGSAIGSTAS